LCFFAAATGDSVRFDWTGNKSNDQGGHPGLFPSSPSDFWAKLPKRPGFPGNGRQFPRLKMLLPFVSGRQHYFPERII
jgi:hypothetical protein